MEQSLFIDRVHGSLLAACIGDALGAPTEQLSIAQIRARWGGRLERFVAPSPDSPFAAGRLAGQITDDASQLLCVADAYIKGRGHITPNLVASALLRWSEDARYSSMVGPSTRAGLEKLRQGADPALTGRQGWLVTDGSSNGAAMRVAPCGLANPGNLERAVQDAVINCLPTHGTQAAMSGAAAIAAAVAGAMAPNSTVQSIVAAARYGAVEGERLGLLHGREVAAPSVVRRIDLAVDLAVRASNLDQAIDDIAAIIGTGLATSEAVPAAIGLFVAADGDPMQAVIAGANAGYDTDTVACMAGAISGALRGAAALPFDLAAVIEHVNGLDLVSFSQQLVTVVLNRTDQRPVSY